MIYQDQDRSFVTRHEAVLSETGPATLGPGVTLDADFLNSLVTSLRGATEVEVLPENVLAKSERLVAWWTPAQRRRMFFQEAQGHGKGLHGKMFPQPALVWRVENESLAIRALAENARPVATTKLAVAPFWNLSEGGSVCLGSMRCPRAASVKSIAGWERGFYESAFTHANVNRLTRDEGGFVGLWQPLADRDVPFPTDSLIRLPQTLQQFLRGGRNDYAN